MSSLSQLMNEYPHLFYTRGGEVLWNAIKKDIGNKPIPNNSNELKSTLSKSFKKITGKDIESRGIFYVDKLNTGGMSGGQISLEFFNEVILFCLDAMFNGQKIDSTHPVFDKWES